MKNQNTITVVDVAKKAGVSKSTVSLVLTHSNKVSEKSKRKVLKAIEDTGYIYNRDAASLRSRRSNLVAIVINDLTNPYSSQLTVALEQQIRNIGMFAILVSSGESADQQSELIQRLEEYKVSAYVICPAPGTRPEFLNNLVDKGRLVINIMREIQGANVSTIIPDNVAGTDLSTNLLLDKGYRKIAFLGGNKSISDYHQRLKGYSTAMINNSDDRTEQHVIQSDTTRDGGRKAMKLLLDRSPDIEAIVCFSDIIAYGAIEYMKEQQIKPGVDIGIIGFDDLKDSQLMSPPLTTIHINENQIARAVCQELVGADSNAHNKILVGVKLIERSSC
ncbi:LacI family DNA-binding transcriptional regulator [Thalassotalea sp. 1_MG-2023]|uniref:LacI family DNA-binding transcriptional regulator n=1 Tax=Thalassotalea sp. 1_MG-2023 TaxID=3062680 RepID=UPI0026E21E8D|nr:LacI family DNA-binding transcriptional regulator [Thalassotalea sp. 1_MG-2023]MDO6426010.1 LacI family DNA-binding transcriptional regulator [Thalassotalea sp. 1_MG-2023]